MAIQTPVARSKSPTIRMTGKPTPAVWAPDWGQHIWLAGVSGMLMVVPSKTKVRGPWRGQSAAAR